MNFDGDVTAVRGYMRMEHAEEPQEMGHIGLMSRIQEDFGVDILLPTNFSFGVFHYLFHQKSYDRKRIFNNNCEGLVYYYYL